MVPFLVILNTQHEKPVNPILYYLRIFWIYRNKMMKRNTSIPLLSFNFGHLLFQTCCSAETLQLLWTAQTDMVSSANTVAILAFLLVIWIGIFSNYYFGLCILLTERRFGPKTRCQLMCLPWNVLDVPHLTGLARFHVFFFWYHWPDGGWYPPEQKD